MSDQLPWFKSSYSDGSGGACIEVALEWRKSTYSDSSGGACIEVAPEWRKSTYSSEGGACVEVSTCPHTIHIRDSKRPDTDPHLTVPAHAWGAFLTYAVTK